MKFKNAIITLSLFFTISISAQWSNDPTLNMHLSDTVSAGSMLTPKAVSDGNNGAIFVWSRGLELYGQRVNNGGVIQWQENGIIVGTARDPNFLSFLEKPVVVSDDSGGAIIVWVEYNKKRIIAASRIRPDGTKVWDKLICFSETGTRTNPAICKDGNSGAFIAWEDTRNGSSNIDIFVQHLNFEGIALWDSNGVAACLAVQNQTVPKVAEDGMGGVFVTWADNRILDSDIYAQLFNTLGTPQFQSNGMPVCLMSNNPSNNPRIVNTQIGEAIIAWTDGRSGGTWDIYAQKVNQDTIGWLSNINGVSVCSEIRSQWKCEMIADGLGGAIISWQDSRRLSFDEEDVYAQKISSVGTAQWGINGIVVCNQPGNPTVLHSIASDGDGGALICWQDNRNGNTDLYVQKVYREGTIMWTENGVAVSTAPLSQITQTICDDGNGGAIIAWSDARHGAFLYIYGQGVDSEGNLGGTTSVDEEVLTNDFKLSQNYPNPFNPGTSIQYAISGRQFVSLKVYDVLGKEIARLVDEYRSEGNYEVTFDASNLASGIYFYKLQAGSFNESKKMILMK
jgi:hypothetical protein